MAINMVDLGSSRTAPLAVIASIINTGIAFSVDDGTRLGRVPRLVWLELLSCNLIKVSAIADIRYEVKGTIYVH
jgi:hypothetical protein